MRRIRVSWSTICKYPELLAFASTWRYLQIVPVGTCICKYLKVLANSTSSYLHLQVPGGTCICKYLEVLANSTFRYLHLQVPIGTCMQVPNRYLHLQVPPGTCMQVPKVLAFRNLQRPQVLAKPFCKYLQVLALELWWVSICGISSEFVKALNMGKWYVGKKYKIFLWSSWKKST